ncbi:hypothetical protein BB561_002939 [Smittium simulii]|uniref:CCHC-type domain-containing protein n=1 Tax=Smittium simulii TaxID=133385 RepID=A0A2T9YNI4_9FUNG|nr:hypothetical protein BB561_002939 [Smittium simulii]
MSDNPVHLTAGQIANAEELLAGKEIEIATLRQQLIDGENSFNGLAEEHSKLESKFNKLFSAYSANESELVKAKQDFESWNRIRLENELALERLKVETATKCEQLAAKEAQLLQKLMEVQSQKSGGVSASGTTTLSNTPKIPAFEGQSISFNRWIHGVDELFTNYPLLNDFQKRILVVDSLKGEARNWYDAEPDGNIDCWDNFRQSLAKQFGGAESLSMALDRIYTLRLTEKSDFNSFIQQVRPAIKIVTGDNSKLAIVMLRKQIDPSIRKYLPENANETFEQFELRLKAQMTEIQSKPARMTADRQSAMEIDPVVAAMKSEENAFINAAQYSSQFNHRFQPVPSRFNGSQFRKPFQRNTNLHSRENTTMTKAQFEEYVRNSVCFNCGQKGHLRSSCPKPPKSARYMNLMLPESLDEEKDKAQ